jgi:hypothetical protein
VSPALRADDATSKTRPSRVQLAGLAQAGPAAGPDGQYAADQRDESLAVVGAGRRDADGHGQTGALGDQVEVLRGLLRLPR